MRGASETQPSSPESLMPPLPTGVTLIFAAVSVEFRAVSVNFLKRLGAGGTLVPTPAILLLLSLLLLLLPAGLGADAGASASSG